MEDGFCLDAALKGESLTPKTIWAGLEHLDGKTVSVVADGAIYPAQEVVDGAVTLPDPAMVVEIGLPYTHIVEPLPPSAIEGAGASRKVRLVEGIFRVQNTAALRLDVGRGLNDVTFKQFGEDDILDTAPPVINGDIRVRALGWQADATKPLWRIEQSAPLPFTLLSVATELKVND